MTLDTNILIAYLNGEAVERESQTLSRFWRALFAVVAGNAIYFLLLSPFLPPRARHQPFRLDWGTVVDFWVCLVVWGLLEIAFRLRKQK